MKPASAKNKGRRAAKEVKAIIMQLFPELTADDVIVASSGQTGEDIIFSARARGLLPISIEVKNREDLLTSRGWQALDQAEANSKDWQPVVIFRRNKTKLRAIIDAEELMALLKVRAIYEEALIMDEKQKVGGYPNGS